MERRISQLDGLRALAFLAVFLRHGIKLPLGWIGVDVFFVLSGYLITRNLVQLREKTQPSRSFFVFYFRRVLRIVPPYYLALAVMLNVQSISMHEAGWYFGFVSNVHDSFVGQIQGVYAPMWSIAVEEQFYLIWPCIVLLVPARRLPHVFVTVIAAAPVIRYLMTPYGFNAIYTLMPCRMDLLAMGALFALLEKRSPKLFIEHGKRFMMFGISAGVVFAVIALSDKTFRTNLGYPLFNVVGFELTGCFAVAVFGYVRGLESGPIYGILMNPILQYVGKVSYMCYLIHLVVLRVVQQAHLGVIPTVALAMVGTLAFASASWYLLEHPLQQFRRLVRPVPA